MQIVIDTHKFVKFLSEEKHFTQKQAEVLIEAATEYHNAYTKELATKQDLALVKKDLQTEIESVRKDLKAEIHSLRKDMQTEIHSLRKDMQLMEDSLRKDMQANFYKTVIALGSINAVITSITIALLSVLK